MTLFLIAGEGIAKIVPDDVGSERKGVRCCYGVTYGLFWRGSRGWRVLSGCAGLRQKGSWRGPGAAFGGVGAVGDRNCEKWKAGALLAKRFGPIMENSTSKNRSFMFPIP